MTVVVHALLDSGSAPDAHASDLEAVARVNMKRRRESPPAPEDAHLFCEHTSYVGFDRALAHFCPFCPEDFQKPLDTA